MLNIYHKSASQHKATISNA